MDNLTPPGQTGPPTPGRVFDRSCQAVFPLALCRPGTQNLLVEGKRPSGRTRRWHEKHKCWGVISPRAAFTALLVVRVSIFRWSGTNSIVDPASQMPTHGRPLTSWRVVRAMEDKFAGEVVAASENRQ